VKAAFFSVIQRLNRNFYMLDGCTQLTALLASMFIKLIIQRQQLLMTLKITFIHHTEWT